MLRFCVNVIFARNHFWRAGFKERNEILEGESLGQNCLITVAVGLCVN